MARARALKVFRCAVDVKRDTGEGIAQTLLNQRYSKVRDVDAYPVAA
jgi:hypothetical protein